MKGLGWVVCLVLCLYHTCGTARMVTELDNWFMFHLYHEGPQCASRVLFFRVDRLRINTCAVMPDGTRHKFVCKEGKKTATIVRYEYGVTGACDRPIISNGTVHEGCRKDKLGSGFFTAPGCGSLPGPVVSADNLLVQEYRDATCTNTTAVSKGILLNVCSPVYGPSLHGLDPVITSRRKVILTSFSGGTAVLYEQLFVVEDEDCRGVVQSTRAAVYYDNNDCRPDPLFPGLFTKRVAHVAQNAGFNRQTVPSWFATFPSTPTNRPTASPTASPTVRPSSIPTPAPSVTATPRPTGAIISQGLMLHLEANTYTSGQYWYDEVSNRAFQLFNAPTVDTLGGGSLRFRKGLQQYAVGPSFANALISFTVELWLYPNQPPLDSASPIMEILGGGKGSNYYFYVDGAEQYNFGYFVDDWARVGGSSTYKLPVGSWSHLLGTFDGSSLCYYLNGARIGTCVTTTQPAPGSSGLGIRLMASHPVTPSVYFDGYLSIVRIYGRALSSSEALFNFQADQARFGV